MSRVDCTFRLRDFQLDSPWGEDDVFFLFLWGEGMALEFWELERLKSISSGEGK